MDLCSEFVDLLKLYNTLRISDNLTPAQVACKVNLPVLFCLQGNKIYSYFSAYKVNLLILYYLQGKSTRAFLPAR